MSPWLVWVLVLPLALGVLGAAVFALTDVGDVPVDNPHLWWLLGAVPLAGLLWLYALTRRRRAMHRFASATLAPLLASRVTPSRPAVRAGLTVLAVGMIVAGIIGPRWGTYLQEYKVRGVDIIVALDVSRSMLADDVEPTRLARAKREIRRQLTERAVFQRAHRLGLVAFAGSTSLKVPLTTDHLSFQSRLAGVGVGSVPRGGTAIAEVIRTVADLFRTSPEKATKIILLFTDGEDHEGGSVEAAKETYENQGILVFTIGVGDPARTFGAQVPAQAPPGRSEVRGSKPLLHDGQIVFSKVNVAGLREIAEAGGGKYAPAGHLHRLVDAIAGYKKEELSTEERGRHKPRYQWFLAAALLLLGFETIIREGSARAGEVRQRLWQREIS